MRIIASRILALVFLASGISKALDRQHTSATLISFGVRKRLVVNVATNLLPASELGVSLLLANKKSHRVGGMMATGLIAIFSSVIALNLYRGNKPSCGCFGRISREEIGWQILARNSLLLSVGILLSRKEDDRSHF